MRSELASTVESLNCESIQFERGMAVVAQELMSISAVVEEQLAPELSVFRKSYSDFVDKRAEVREALILYAAVQDIERRKAELEKCVEDEKIGVLASAALPFEVTHDFSDLVENILADWNFPEVGEVHFDSKNRDLVIAGKSRSAFGKGLRAITYAPVTLGLLMFCRQHRKPHPGFVVLASPLLAYRAPEGTEDDLTGTDPKEKFYEYLEALPDDTQVIVIENTDPPDIVMKREQLLMFGKNPNHGRYGLFPFAGGRT